MIRQGGQGTQGACLGGDDTMITTNRTFMNERTDLTATEVSPRMTAEVVERSSGKLIRINTRKVKPSQEKTSIRMLNVKGRIQTNQIKRMLETMSVGTSNNGSS